MLVGEVNQLIVQIDAETCTPSLEDITVALRSRLDITHASYIFFESIMGVIHFVNSRALVACQ